MPIERKGEKTQSLVVGGTTEKVVERLGLAAGGFHGSQARDRYRVEPGEDVGREELIDGHADEAVPKDSQGLGALDLLPVQTLQSLHCRESSPVDSFDVPDANRTDDTADTVTEQTNGDGAEDDCGCADGQIIKDILSREHHDAGSGIRGGRGSDGANGMFLEVPRSRVQKLDCLEPQRQSCRRVSGSELCFLDVASRHNRRPSITGEIGDEHNESTGDIDLGWLEL